MKLIRLLPWFAGFAVCAATAHADLASLFTNTSAPAKVSRPSIIFIQCHGLAQGDLSCYGQTNFQTPVLDRLAREGVRFTHYSGAGAAPQTIAAVLNGGTHALAEGEANLAQRLRVAGYRTALIGEWSQPGKPWERGFDEFAGFLADAEGRNYYADYLWRFAPRAVFHGQNPTPTDYVGKEMIYPNTGGKRGQYLPDTFFKAAMNFVRINHPDESNHERPFFLLVNLPAPRSAAANADEFPVPSDAPYTGEPWPQAAKNRAALIGRLDDNMGRLLEQLKKMRQTNDVAIFFSSSAAPVKFADTNLDFMLPPSDFRSAGNEVKPPLPMIVWWPGTVSPGQVSDRAWSAADFAATALDMARPGVAVDFGGKSVLPALLARPQDK